jgi:purine nucleoside phosphorylase I, inosine and guanosine-specific
MTYYDEVKKAADYILSKTTNRPEIGIVLGSGLGSLVDSITDQCVIPYRDIPGFPHSHLQGHADQLIIGRIGGHIVAAMQGRFHYYEGFTMKELCFPIYVLKQVGVSNLIVTNACGGINSYFHPGDLMLITDYINTLADNSLIGENDERFGPRFPDMSEPYSKELQAMAHRSAKKLSLTIQEGVYAVFSGPCFESAAEIHALSVLGADAVGMSTVPETIAANYLGMKVLGIACITNMGTGIAKEKHTHEDVLKTAEIASKSLCSWVKDILENW